MRNTGELEPCRPLANDAVVAFLQEANPQALEAMRNRFSALLKAGLWQTRRNTICHTLEAVG